MIGNAFTTGFVGQLNGKYFCFILNKYNPCKVQNSVNTSIIIIIIILNKEFLQSMQTLYFKEFNLRLVLFFFSPMNRLLIFTLNLPLCILP